MRDVNKVIVVGRLGAHPIQRQTKSGKTVTHFSVGTTRRYIQETNLQTGISTYGEETQWHRIVCWGKQAEASSKYLRKGSAVYVEGNIRSHAYTDKQGQSRFSFEIYADNLSFLGDARLNSPQYSRSQSVTPMPAPELGGESDGAPVEMASDDDIPIELATDEAASVTVSVAG